MSSDIDSAVGGGKPFSIGSVIGETFSLYGGNFLKFSLIGILIYLPILVILALTLGVEAVTGAGMFDFETGTPDPGAVAAMAGGLGLTMVLTLVAFALGSGAITYGAIESKSGQQVSVGGMLGRAFVRMVPLIGASLLVFVLVFLGFMLFVIPGIILSLMMAVVWPVVLAENIGPVEAMRRSRELTKGHKWGIFGAYIVVGILSSLIQSVFLVIVFFGGATGAILGDLIGSAVSLSLSSTFMAALYTNLRESKEGVSIEQMAAVFE